MLRLTDPSRKLDDFKTTNKSIRKRLHSSMLRDKTQKRFITPRTCTQTFVRVLTVGESFVLFVPSSAFSVTSRFQPSND